MTSYFSEKKKMGLSIQDVELDAQLYEPGDVIHGTVRLKESSGCHLSGKTFMTSYSFSLEEILLVKSFGLSK